MSWLDRLGLRVGWLNSSSTSVSTGTSTSVCHGLVFSLWLLSLGLWHRLRCFRFGSWLGLLDHDDDEVSILDVVLGHSLACLSQYFTVGDEILALSWHGVLLSNCILKSFNRHVCLDFHGQLFAL